MHSSASGSANNLNRTAPNLQHLETSLKIPDVSMFRTILQSLSNVDVTLEKGWTALMCACHYGSLEKVEMLLKAGADPCFVSSPDMETPFTTTASATKSDDDCVACIQALLQRIPAENRETIINAKNRVNMTALMHAARTGKANTIKKLIRSGALVDEVDAKGYSALRFAVSTRKIPCCRALVEAGADPNLAAKDGLTPLNRAEGLGVPQLIEILTKTSKVEFHTPGNPTSARIDSGLHGSLSSVHASSKTSPGASTNGLDGRKSGDRHENGNANGSKASLNNLSAKFDSGSSSSLNDIKTTPSASPAVPNKVSSEKATSHSGVPHPTLPAVKSSKAMKPNENGPGVTKEPSVKQISVSDILRPKHTSNLPATDDEKPPSGSVMLPMTPLLQKTTTPPSNAETVEPENGCEKVPTEKQNDMVLENVHPVNAENVSNELAENVSNELVNEAVYPEPPEITVAPASNKTEPAAQISTEFAPKLPQVPEETVAVKIEQNSVDSSQDANFVKEEDGACNLACSSVSQMDELEMLLSSMNLTCLVPIFRRNNITLQELICLDDEDLKKLGIESMGARKKIMEGAHLFNVTTFEQGSIPSVYDRNLTCKDYVHVFSNIASHLGSLVGTTVYARRQLCRLPQLLLKTEAAPNQNIDTLLCFIEDAEHCSSKLHEELELLKQNVKQIQARTEILPKYMDAAIDKKIVTSSEPPSSSSSSSSSLVLVLFSTVLGAGLLGLGTFLLYKGPDSIPVRPLSKLVKLPRLFRKIF